MWLTSAFVRRPTLVSVMLALILLAGTVASFSLVKQRFPSVVTPSVEITLTYPGASTSEMRDAIARPVEDQLAGTPNLEHLTTTIEPGTARLVALFTLGSDSNDDLIQIQGRLQNAQRSLPNDIPAPQIAVANPDESIVVSLALLTHSLAPSELSSLAINRVLPALEQIPGVSAVQPNGDVTPAISVNVDPARLAASGTTFSDLISTVTNNNIRSPGGILTTPNRETNLDVRGDITNVASVGQLVITGSSATTPTTTDPWQTAAHLLRINDVATVIDGSSPQRVFAFSHGQPCITLDIQKSAGFSEVDTSNAVLAALPALKRSYPDITFEVLNVESKATQDELLGVVRTLIEAIILTGVVMLFFLHSWRNALVVAIAIPTSLLVTLGAMRVMNFTLDTVSLLAMTLIIGILVDDSIVVLENIERHLGQGESPIDAAIRGRSEIGLAAIVITLVDVVVFLPISFLPGTVGLFLREFGLVVSVATLTSLAISFTVTPTLAAHWSLRSTWRPWPIIIAFTDGFERVRRFYLAHLLNPALRRGHVVVLGSALLLLGALLLLPLGLVGYEYLPPVDRGEITLTLRDQSGEPITSSVVMARRAEAIVDREPDLAAEATTAGAYRGAISGFLTDAAVAQIDVFLRTDRHTSTTTVAQRLQHQIEQALPHTLVAAIPATSMDGGLEQPLSYSVTALQGDASAAAARVTTALMHTRGAVNVTSSASALSPQLSVTFDRERARALSATIGTGASAVAAAFGGTIATQFTGPDGLKDVIVTYPLAAQNSVASLLAIPLRTSSGSIIHLADIASLVPDPAPPLLLRIDRRDTIAVGANIAPGTFLSAVQHDANTSIRALNLSKNILVTPALGGDQTELSDTLHAMGITLLLSTFLVYLLMVALYNDYRKPFIIMFSVPVAAVGALGALAITHQTINLFSLIGTVLLVGLVAKNGILLVDFAAMRERAGMSRDEAIRAAARERLRPIAMTTLAMIAGMLPLACTLDPGAAAASSLGIVVIGGLTSSLLLTLVLVPVVYVRLAGPPPEHIPPQDIGAV